MRSKDKEIENYIIKVIIEESGVTQKEVADYFDVTERTIRRYYKNLKDKKIIYLERVGKQRKWRIK